LLFLSRALILLTGWPEKTFRPCSSTSVEWRGERQKNTFFSLKYDTLCSSKEEPWLCVAYAMNTVPILVSIKGKHILNNCFLPFN
jgi:hypothetical protein